MSRRTRTDVSNILVASAKQVTEYLFKENSDIFFEIPFYQREYSWEAKYCKRLFEDIMEANELFLGSTILCPKEADANLRHGFEIVDGQQRIISITIMAAALRDYINSNLLNNKDLLKGDQKLLINVKEMKYEIINRFLQNNVTKSYSSTEDVDYNKDPNTN